MSALTPDVFEHASREWLVEHVNFLLDQIGEGVVESTLPSGVRYKLASAPDIADTIKAMNARIRQIDRGQTAAEDSGVRFLAFEPAWF